MRNQHIIALHLVVLGLIIHTNAMHAQALEVEGDVVAKSIVSPTARIGALKGDSLTTTDAQIAALHANRGLSVGSDGIHADGNFVTGGWTQLGDSTDTSFPAIKIKQVMGRTASGLFGNNDVALPHGLNSSTFISVSPVVIYDESDGNGVTENYEFNPGFEFHIYWDATDIHIASDVLNSYNITDKPVIITIIYQE